MGEYTYLIGAQDVRAAAGTISRAADTMREAAATMDSTLNYFLREVQQLVTRIEVAIEEAKEIHDAGS